MKTKLLKNKLYLLTLAVMLFSLSLGNLALAQEGEDPIPEPDAVADATDTAFPSDVEGVVATGGDGSVTLSWDVATDNVGVEGYKIFYGDSSVSTDSASYTMGPVDVGDVLTYEVTGLDNDTAYYFAITAYDAAGNESEFYSLEASGTPTAGGATSSDTTAPQAVSAEAVYNNLVKLTFSEAVVLPATAPESAFSIKDDFLGTALEVTSVEMDSEDATNKTVLLSTAEQSASSKYIITVGIEVEDLAGNPIVSGTSDTAVFTGTDTPLPVEDLSPAAEETPADTIAPALQNVVAIDGNTVMVTFSEPVVLLTNAAENFIITDVNDNTKLTNVTKVEIKGNGAQAELMTEDMEAKQYNLIVIKVKDLAGNEIPVQNSATTFAGMAAVTEAPVVDPPVEDTPQTLEDAVSDLMAKKMADMMVQLTWKTKEDKMADVANFVLYMSTDRGATYGTGKTIAKDLLSYDYSNLEADMTYYFKLTTKNAAGEESEGVVTYLTLPETGPELLFLLFGSAGAGAWITRRKKK